MHCHLKCRRLHLTNYSHGIEKTERKNLWKYFSSCNMHPSISVCINAAETAGFRKCPLQYCCRNSPQPILKHWKFVTLCKNQTRLTAGSCCRINCRQIWGWFTVAVKYIRLRKLFLQNINYSKHWQIWKVIALIEWMKEMHVTFLQLYIDGWQTADTHG